MPGTWNWCVSLTNLGEDLNSRYLKLLGNLKNPFSLIFFTAFDFFRIFLKLKSSNMRVIAKKEIKE